jgi:hypothetical protein
VARKASALLLSPLSFSNCCPTVALRAGQRWPLWGHYVPFGLTELSMLVRGLGAPQIRAPKETPRGAASWALGEAHRRGAALRAAPLVGRTAFWVVYLRPAQARIALRAPRHLKTGQCGLAERGALRASYGTYHDNYIYSVAPRRS